MEQHHSLHMIADVSPTGGVSTIMHPVEQTNLQPRVMDRLERQTMQIPGSVWRRIVGTFFYMKK